MSPILLVCVAVLGLAAFVFLILAEVGESLAQLLEVIS